MFSSPKPRVVMGSTLSSPGASRDVITTTSDAAGGDGVGIMIALCFSAYVYLIKCLFCIHVRGIRYRYTVYFRSLQIRIIHPPKSVERPPMARLTGELWGVFYGSFLGSKSDQRFGFLPFVLYFDTALYTTVKYRVKKLKLVKLIICIFVIWRQLA